MGVQVLRGEGEGSRPAVAPWDLGPSLLPTSQRGLWAVLHPEGGSPGLCGGLRVCGCILPMVGAGVCTTLLVPTPKASARALPYGALRPVPPWSD